MAVPEANSQHDADRVPLGQLLVDSGLLDAADLERVLEEQRRTGAPLGRMLVDGGYVAELDDRDGARRPARRPPEDGVRLCDGSPERDSARSPAGRRAVRCLAAAAPRRAVPRNRSRSRHCCSPPSRRPSRSRARRAGPTSSLRPPPARSHAGAGNAGRRRARRASSLMPRRCWPIPHRCSSPTSAISLPASSQRPSSSATRCATASTRPTRPVVPPRKPRRRVRTPLASRSPSCSRTPTPLPQR